MVCSNCAVYDPLMSHNGGYGSTMPKSHRFFKAIKYLLSPKRSSHLRQKARVPKFSLMTFNKCFVLGSLIGTCPTSNFSYNVNIPCHHEQRLFLCFQRFQWHTLLLPPFLLPLLLSQWALFSQRYSIWPN